MTSLNTVLIVEDDKIIRHMLRDILEHDGFLTMEASSCRRANEVLLNHTADLMLLDLTLPDGCSLEHIQNYKTAANIPIIIVSGDEDESKKIRGFELGADDFVSKPFNPDLLLARTRSHMRKYKNHIQGASRAQVMEENRAVQFGQWTLDPMQLQCFKKDGASAGLTPREFKLLNTLIRNAGKVQNRLMLCDAIKEENYIPSAKALNIKIIRLRKKLVDIDEKGQPYLIKSIRGIGYIFNKEQILQS